MIRKDNEASFLLCNETFGIATKALIYKAGKYLLLYKSESEDINPSSFDTPGGRLQFGEKPEEAIAREVKEEIGLHVKVLGLFNVWTFTKGQFQLVGIDFFCLFRGGREKLSEEHSSLIWATPRQIAHGLDYPTWIKKTIKKAEEFRMGNNL